MFPSEFPVASYSHFVLGFPTLPNPSTLFHFGFGDPSASHCCHFSSVLSAWVRHHFLQGAWASPSQFIIESECAPLSVMCADRALRALWLV